MTLTLNMLTIFKCFDFDVLLVKHFDFDLTCDVITDPEVNNITLPSNRYILQIYRMPLEFCKSDQ